MYGYVGLCRGMYGYVRLFITMSGYVKACTSSETQGQSVGSGEKAGRKFSCTGERAPGYRLSPNYFQKFKQMPASANYVYVYYPRFTNSV